MPRRPIDQRIDFLSPLSLVPGLGPKRVEAFSFAGIETMGDLLYHFPRRYLDRSVVTPLGELHNYIGQTRTVVGEITRTRVERGRRSRFRVQVTDKTGTLEVIWFHGISYLRQSIRTGKRVQLTGKVSVYGKCQMAHPLMESLGANQEQSEVPFLARYPVSSSMREASVHQKLLHESIQWILKNMKHWPAMLPSHIEQRYCFPPLSECLAQMHVPKDPANLESYKARIKFEELFQLAITLRWTKRAFRKPGRKMTPGHLYNQFQNVLPFVLTDEQKRAIESLHQDAASETRMHRLLQGDVGSGKTVVALAACLPALNEGLQVAWLSPTEILATQSFEVLTRWLVPLGFEPILLTGATPESERRRIRAELMDGSRKVIVGTHALLQPGISFGRLGMAIIDEQHRFGVRQRRQMQDKDPATDFLLMSATPIPQTLAKTLYGDLEVISIRSRPAEHCLPATHLVPERKRLGMEKFILEKIRNDGTKVFWVSPRIEADEEGEEDRSDVESSFESLKKGALSAVKTEMLHGSLSPEVRRETMARFVDGDTHILASTTVIEVGVDVPSARIMVIESAECFGLAQLHQLRGRVGRHGGDAYCFLLASVEPGSISEDRLRLFCREHDGFKIAERDLHMRGPGEVTGYRQSGWEDLRMADILRDADLFREIQSLLERSKATASQKNCAD